jgi:hypothetical protein
MINYHETLVKALNNILPTYYEMILTRGIKTPCISYMELGNIPDSTGDTMEYSRVRYQIKVWGNELDVIQNYSMEIDRALRPLGFRRVGCNELSDNNSTMIQKILTYEALALERF